MQFIVESRYGVEKGILVRCPYIVISIRDPDKRPVRIPRTVGLRKALRLSFHDAEPTTAMRLPDSIQLMTVHDAEQIWQFVQSHLSHIGAIVCHCEQGMSRSPAVAAAPAEALGEDPEPVIRWTQPNQAVYQLLKRTIARLQQDDACQGCENPTLSRPRRRVLSQPTKLSQNLSNRSELAARAF